MPEDILPDNISSIIARLRNYDVGLLIQFATEEKISRISSGSWNTGERRDPQERRSGKDRRGIHITIGEALEIQPSPRMRRMF